MTEEKTSLLSPVLKPLSYVARAFLRLLLLLVFLGFLWCAGFALFIADARIMEPQEPDARTDAIVVLTGGENRIETGIALLAAGLSAHAFISGVHPDTPISTIAQRAGSNLPSPTCCVELGKLATTTVENAIETKAWLDKNNFTSLRLVTSDYHMRRAALEFRSIMPGMKIILHPVHQQGFDFHNRQSWIVWLSEYHKTLFRAVQRAAEKGADVIRPDERPQTP